MLNNARLTPSVASVLVCLAGSAFTQTPVSAQFPAAAPSASLPIRVGVIGQRELSLAEARKLVHERVGDEPRDEAVEVALMRQDDLWFRKR